MEEKRNSNYIKAVNETADSMRVELKSLGKRILKLKKSIQEANNMEEVNVGEILANITLSYRSIENTSMRLGKVKQHLNNGISIYDKNVVGSPE